MFRGQQLTKSGRFRNDDRADAGWGLGKCSYKMLFYMACGVPVVVSLVGMNAEVLAQEEIGYGPKDLSEWVEALECLLRAPDRSVTMGKAGRKVIEQHYSVSMHAPVLASF